MAKSHKPVAGSRAYWPRKRAKRIYSRIKSHVPAKDAVPLSFAAYKAGMIQVIVLDNRKGSTTEGQEIVRPVTVLDAPDIVVCGIKLYKKGINGLESQGVVWAENLAKDLKRKTKVPGKIETKKMLEEREKELDKVYEIRLLVHTKPRESGIRKKKPELFEISLGGDVNSQWGFAKQKLGSEIKATEVLKEGEMIDAKSVDKGKGYQGPVKRFGIKIRSRKHEKKRRHVGNLGARNVARVLPGKLAMPGQLGYQTRTEYNKKVIKIGNAGKEVNPKGGFLNYGLIKGNYILLEGSVPGPRKRLIMIRKGLRSKAKAETIEVKKIIQDSQQGA